MPWLGVGSLCNAQSRVGYPSIGLAGIARRPKREPTGSTASYAREIVLLALGNPSQELWIAPSREEKDGSESYLAGECTEVAGLGAHVALEEHVAIDSNVPD